MVVEWEVVATTALRLLKTDPSVVSSSSSDSIATTLLFFSRGFGVDEARAVARGMAAMGAEGTGVGAAWAESIEAEGAEALASLSAP